MEARLYVVHGSHPCACVERALELKGIPYRKVELPPSMHAPVQKLLFGRRTVPGIRLDGEKVVGSREILRRLDELRPDPPLYPRDATERAKVEEAERWGDEVLQPLGRRLLWMGLRRHPGAMASLAEGSSIPLPGAVVGLLARPIVPIEMRLNHATRDTIGPDLAALPGHLDRVDAWLEEGVLGGEQPNAADLQIAPSLRLLSTLGDVRPLLEGRPCDAWARRLFPRWAGDVPAGSLAA